jgi:signal transduction histidine kinase
VIVRRLRTRLLVSHVAVVAVGAAAMLVVGTVVTRSEYQRRIGGFGRGRGAQQGATSTELQRVLDESLVPALLVGAAAGLAAAVLAAWFVGRRLIRPVDDLRTVSRRIAGGDYSARATVPTELELASLAEDVNALAGRLEATEQRRSHLLAEVAHELRTPITVVRGQMEALLDRVVEPTDEVFATVADEASRLQRLVDDLSLLSRADEGALAIETERIDLGELAARAVVKLEPQFVHAGVSSTIDAASGPLIVRGDRDRLAQVLTNLLGNALGHTPAGGAVTVRTARSGGLAVVDVIDTGRGIPVDELERIFDRFYRLPDAEARAGRGIGLTIARSLARAHGGDVVASSAGPGTGATFRLTVPLAP